MKRQTKKKQAPPPPPPPPDGPAPLRPGPRPLPLILSLGMLQWLTWPAALPLWNGSEAQESLLPLDPEQQERRQHLLSDLKKLQAKGPQAVEKLEQTVAQLACDRYEAFLAGIARYCHSPIKRTVRVPPALWQEGSTRLLDYGGTGPVVLVVPSLVNRYHVMDITEEVSFIRALKAHGFRPLIVNWDAPGAVERNFTLDDYIKRLRAMLGVAYAENKQKPVSLIGYCMGGMLTAALAQFEPEKTGKLMFLATPWDFHAGDPMEGMRMKMVMEQLRPLFEGWEEVPVDVMQTFFILQQPFMVVEKFRRFGALPENSPAVRDFVILEEWVNDGVPLPKAVGVTCLEGWYVENQPFREQWEVMGACVKPDQLSKPNLHVIPARDRIVPPASALALAELVPGAEILRPAFGHVSMMAHPEAKERLWPKLFDWLASPATRQ